MIFFFGTEEFPYTDPYHDKSSLVKGGGDGVDDDERLFDCHRHQVSRTSGALKIEKNVHPLNGISTIRFFWVKVKIVDYFQTKKNPLHVTALDSP